MNADFFLMKKSRRSLRENMINDFASTLDNEIRIYRAVGADEYSAIIRTNQFAVLDSGLHVKHFGLNYEETLDFANKDLNVDVVAVFEVSISQEALKIVGDFTHVDPYIFKSGTVEIRADRLTEFNNAILSITHKK